MLVLRVPGDISLRRTLECVSGESIERERLSAPTEISPKRMAQIDPKTGRHRV